MANAVGEVTGLFGAYEAFSGRDAVTGEAIGGGERLLEGAFLAGGAGSGLLRGIKRTIDRAQGAGVTFDRLGDFTRAVWEVPGDKGAGFVRWNRILDDDGNTIRLYKDVHDQGGDFLRRDFYVGAPRN